MSQPFLIVLEGLEQPSLKKIAFSDSIEKNFERCAFLIYGRQELEKKLGQ